LYFIDFILFYYPLLKKVEQKAKRREVIIFEKVDKPLFQKLLCRAASVDNPRLRVTNTTTCLISADTIGKVVVVCSKLIGAIVAHPSTSGARANRERDTVIGHDLSGIE
jgi:hypothetical protein